MTSLKKYLFVCNNNDAVVDLVFVFDFLLNVLPSAVLALRLFVFASLLTGFGV